MPPGKTLFKLALGAVALAGIVAGAGALSPQTPPHALADGPAPSPVSPHYSFPIGITWAVPVQYPQLTNLELQPVVAPGGLIKVDGANFGAERGNGTLCLEWSIVVVQNVYTAQSRLCADVVDWSDTRVIAQVPRDVEGVPDQTAQIVLTRDDGAPSNRLDLSFVATREEVPLGFQPVGVQISCVDYTASDNCNENGGAHSAGFPISSGTIGTDTYHFHLANGWTFDRMNFTIDAGSVSTPATPAAGASDFTFTVNWSYGGFTTDAIYTFGITVLGPKGVPMQ